jgi:hypothetical protein
VRYSSANLESITIMSTSLRLLTAATLAASLFIAHAQFGRGSGGGPSGPDLSGAMAKIFGDHPAFAANTDIRTKIGESGAETVIPGKLAYLDGKSRFEIDMAQMKGGQVPPGAAERMKQMGMDKIVIVALPEKKLTYLIYPGLEAYAEIPTTNPDAAKGAANYELKVTELGKETVEGRSCLKNKAEVTDHDGKKREFTVWNATDLKKFPLKVETKEGATNTVMQFKDVTFDKPAADQFAPPAAYSKYDNVMSMMQQEMMKKMGNMQMPR